MSLLYINDVLTADQKIAFRELAVFKKTGVLAGGTGLAIQLKHRRSFDFDIFTFNDIPENFSWEIRKVFGQGIKMLKESENELTFLTPKKVKITFFHYPFKHLYKIVKSSVIPVFDWKDIAADKAYTIGRRPIYRDYIDMFFIVKKGHKIENIILDAKKKFKGLFSEKLFLNQLIYLEDIQDFHIEFLKEKYKPQEIKSFFEKIVSQYAKNIFKQK